MKAFRIVVLAAAFFAAGCGVALWAQEDGRRRAARLPAAVTNALHQFYPGAELRDVDEYGDGSDRTYELEVRLPQKRTEGKLKLMPDGALVENKEEKLVDAPPELVRKSLTRAFPKARINETRIVTRTVVTYEIHVREGERRREITVSPRGKILEVENR